MKHLAKCMIAVGALFLLFPTTSFAYWQCYAFNERARSYIGYGFTQQDAESIALASCKDQNKHYQRCKTASSFCIHLNLSQYREKCLVRDGYGRTKVAYNCKTAIQSCHNWQMSYGGGFNPVCQANPIDL